MQVSISHGTVQCKANLEYKTLFKPMLRFSTMNESVGSTPFYMMGGGSRSMAIAPWDCLKISSVWDAELLTQTKDLGFMMSYSNVVSESVAKLPRGSQLLSNYSK